MSQLRVLVDFTVAYLGQTAVTRRQSAAIVERARRRILALFPGSGETFDLIYGSRFRRIIEERFGER